MTAWPCDKHCSPACAAQEDVRLRRMCISGGCARQTLGDMGAQGTESATPWTAAYQAPLPTGFSRQEYWSGVPLPSPKEFYKLTIVSCIRYFLFPLFQITSLLFHSAVIQFIRNSFLFLLLWSKDITIGKYLCLDPVEIFVINNFSF